ncbi:MAG TPA: oligosaccharide flippase family protein, partial [Longimicrobiales bacterium]|nr:oligosaccharide flippase family protein [Longimicrobiales bacterium]
MSTSQTSPRITATLSNLTLLGAGEILTRALTFVAFAYLGRVLEPSSFGLVGSVLAVMMLGTLLVDQGLGTIGARDVAMDISVAPTTIDRVVSAQLLLAIGVVCLVFLGSWLVPADPTL